MLKITDRAADALRSLRPTGALDTFVRIHPSALPQGNGTRGLSVDLVEAPEPDDEQVVSQGVEVWLAAAAVPLLEDKILDSQTDPRGWLTFILHAA